MPANLFVPSPLFIRLGKSLVSEFLSGFSTYRSATYDRACRWRDAPVRRQQCQGLNYLH